MSADTMELEQQLVVEKDLLRTSLETIGNRASEALDWRHQVRAHPVEVIGAAAMVGVLVGVLTARPSQASRKTRMGSEPGNGAADSAPAVVAPEWHRLKAGLVGLVADRAIVVAKGFLDGAMDRKPSA